MAFNNLGHSRSNVENDRILALIARHNSKAFPSDDCFPVRIESDFMAPFLRPGDVVIVDPADTDVTDAIYAFDGPEYSHLVARVSNDFQGNVELFGDNKTYVKQSLTRERAQLICAGRVVAICKHV